MKTLYKIENKIVFNPNEYKIWQADDPEAALTLYSPVSQCLLLMIQHRNQVLRQDLFFREVWEERGLTVNVSTFYQNIALLRKAMKSLGIKRNIILTVPRQGIKFVGEIEYVSLENEQSQENNSNINGEEEDSENVTEEIIIDNRKAWFTKSALFFIYYLSLL